MALPKGYRTYRRTTGELPTAIELSTERLPDELRPKDVIIKVRAVALNYRDPAMLHGTYPASFEAQGIPCSDCAAEVVAVGSSVKDFKIGDRVAPIYDLTTIRGDEDEPPLALGGTVPGVLREFAVFAEHLLVHLPKHMSWAEVSSRLPRYT
nr:zinc-type alcohol dehydrogenase-like protein [Quercus suber]